MIIANINFDAGIVKAKKGETVVCSDEKLIKSLINTNIVKMVEPYAGHKMVEPVLENEIAYDYSEMTVKQLQELCRSKGMAIRGNKKKLIERLNS